MREREKGVLLGAAAAALWGSTYVAIRLLYRLSDLDAVGITFSRFLIGGLALAGAALARGQGRRLAAFHRDPIPFFWLGLTGVAGMGILVAIASALTEAANVSLIMNANPVFVALLAPAIGERLTAGRVAGAVLGLAGVAVVVLGTGGSGPSLAHASDLWGSLAAVGAGLAWAAYTLLGKGVVRRYGGFFTTTLAMLWGALLLGVVLGTAHVPARPSLPTVLLLLYLGLLPSALAFALWYRALALVDAATLAPTQYVAPGVTVLLAWLFLGESVAPTFVAGLILIFAGIALASRKGPAERGEDQPGVDTIPLMR